MTSINLDVLPKTIFIADKLGQLMSVKAAVEEYIEPYVEKEKTIKRYFWNDGSGGSSALYISQDTNEAMLTFYDHESPLNAFAFGDTVGDTKLAPFTFQKSMYVGLPEYFISSVTNQEDSYSFLNIEDPDGEDKILYASGVIYFDGSRWTPTPFYEKMLDEGETGGFNYLIDSSWLNIDLFPIKLREYKKYWSSKDDPLLAKVKELGL